MTAHFAAFSFVDRITEFIPGKRARAEFHIPRGISAFPACLVAEAVGQLAAWVAMDLLDFRGRPVAALATETRFLGTALPGDTLTLAVEIEDCDDHMVAYGGNAFVGRAPVIELEHCLGPMLPVADFDAPDALRSRLALLRGDGAPPDRFEGVDLPEPVVTAHVPGESLRATLGIPVVAPFFGDHFPRRPVFPATLLLDAQIRLAAQLAREHARRGQRVASRMTHVKMRAFIAPGDEVELEAKRASDEGDSGRVLLTARVGGKTVATARVEFVEGAAT